MFQAFLNQRAQQLQQVNNRASLADWHTAYAEAWCPDASALAASANRTLGLAGDFAIRDELGYLAVESARQDKAEQTWLLLSVNPSWEEAPNALERRLKGQGDGDGGVNVADYQGYRSQYFPRWYNETKRPTGGGGTWWNKALNFLHDCAGLPRAAGMVGRDPRLDVIGWELWPLHSPKDGLTQNIGNDALRGFAAASVAAALRVMQSEQRPGGLVLASPVGFDLLPMLAIPGLVPGQAAWVGGIQVRRYTYETRTIATIRRQMFAAWLSAETTGALAAWVQGAPPAQVAPQPPAPPAVPAPAPAAAQPAPAALHNVVMGILGPCKCRGPKGKKCPANWHTFPRGQGAGARAFVEGASLVKVNIPRGGGVVPGFEAAATQAGVHFDINDDRNPTFRLYNVSVDVNNNVHRAFLATWLPRTIA